MAAVIGYKLYTDKLTASTRSRLPCEMGGGRAMQEMSLVKNGTLKGSCSLSRSRGTLRQGHRIPPRHYFVLLIEGYSRWRHGHVHKTITEAICKGSEKAEIDTLQRERYSLIRRRRKNSTTVMIVDIKEIRGKVNR